MNHNCPVCGINLKWRILGKQCPKCESLLESNVHSDEKKIVKINFIPFLGLGIPIFIVRIFAGDIAFAQNLMLLWILIQIGSMFFAFRIYKRIPKNWARYCIPKQKRN